MTKERKEFIIRAILWGIFACGIPVGFIGWRYEIFKKVGTLQLSGWGLMATIIIAVFLYIVIKYIKAGFVEWSMVKQVISGLIKIVLPLGALLAISISLRDSLDTFIQALSCTIMSEVIAIPLNPFPKWVWEKSEGRFESALDFMADRLHKKKKED